MHSRRHFLASALASGVVLAPSTRLFAAADFRNTKEPSTWTEDEIVLVTSKSPWARATVPGFKGSADPTGISSGAPVDTAGAAPMLLTPTTSSIGSRTGPPCKAKFDAKEMIYHGKLAV